MGICILFVPESPWYYARHGQKDKCIKVMRRLYGNIPEYDYEEEYAILAKTLEMERQLILASMATPWTDIFKGVNGVSSAPIQYSWADSAISKRRLS